DRQAGTAVHLLEELGVAVDRVRPLVLDALGVPPLLRDPHFLAMREALDQRQRQKDLAISSQQYEHAAELRDREIKLLAQLEQLAEALTCGRDKPTPSR